MLFNIGLGRLFRSILNFLIESGQVLINFTTTIAFDSKNLDKKVD